MIVFIHQLRQLRQGAVGIGAGHRRRQVIDDDGMAAALGLRAFAGVVDDEGVKQWQVRQQGVWEAVFRQAHAFARQPFERAVFAYMHNGVRLPLIAQPAIQCIVMVCRWQIRLVVNRIRIHAIAARRLQRHEGVAQLNTRQRKMIIMHIGHARRRTPLRRHLLSHLQWQLGKPRRILRRRYTSGRARHLLSREIGVVVSTTVYQFMNQRRATLRQMIDAITRAAHGVQNMHEGSRCIQADGIADLRRFAIGIGEYKGHALMRVGRALQPRKTCRDPSHARYAIRQRFVFDQLIRQAAGAG